MVFTQLELLVTRFEATISYPLVVVAIGVIMRIAELKILVDLGAIPRWLWLVFARMPVVVLLEELELVVIQV